MKLAIAATVLRPLLAVGLAIVLAGCGGGGGGASGGTVVVTRTAPDAPTGVVATAGSANISV